MFNLIEYGLISQDSHETSMEFQEILYPSLDCFMTDTTINQLFTHGECCLNYELIVVRLRMHSFTKQHKEIHGSVMKCRINKFIGQFITKRISTS